MQQQQQMYILFQDSRVTRRSRHQDHQPPVCIERNTQQQQQQYWCHCRNVFKSVHDVEEIVFHPTTAKHEFSTETNIDDVIVQ